MINHYSFLPSLTHTFSEKWSKSPHFCHFRTFSDTVVVPFCTFLEISLHSLLISKLCAPHPSGPHHNNNNSYNNVFFTFTTTLYGMLNPQQPSGDHCLHLRSTTLRTHFFPLFESRPSHAYFCRAPGFQLSYQAIR